VKTDAPSVVVEFQCAVCGAWLDPMHVDLGLEGSSVCAFCGTPQPGQVGTHRDPGSNGDRPISLIETSELLRNARERRGESLDQVADATGIRQTYLEELEAGGASFEPYPGLVYGRFFLREYADHLGLEPGPLLDAFDGEARSDEPLSRDATEIRRWRRSPSAALIAIVCLVAVFATRAILPREDGTLPAVTMRYAPVSGREHNQAPHAPTAHGSVDGLRAVATLASASWIEALADGRTVYRATAPAGEVLTFVADRRLELTLGNAGGVALEVNGEPRRTGPVGGVVHRVFELRDGTVASVPA
jgi:cytoskeleton protein RodZ